MIAESTFDPANSERVAVELLEEYPHIDGIVAGNDLIAIGIVKAALQKGFLFRMIYKLSDSMEFL